MEVLHKKNEKRGKFYVEKQGHELAEMSYSREPGRLVIEHTEVDESLRGQNVGFELVKSGVEYAREQDLKIVPLCTFAKKIIDENPAFHDVL